MTNGENRGRSLRDIGSDFEDPIEELESSKDVESFTDDENESIALDKIRRAVRRYGEDGITVPEIEEVTDLSQKTIRKHLDTLRHLREVYRQKRTGKTYFWYPNGTPLHSFGKKRVESGETIIDLQVAEKQDDEYFLHITEKRYSLMEGETVEGAVIIPVDAVEDVKQKLDDLTQEVVNQ